MRMLRSAAGEVGVTHRNGWGGRRPGAGRPAVTGRRYVAHVKREFHQGHWPVLVTLRARCRSLRTQFVFPTVRGAIVDAGKANPSEFRVCGFSVQGDHVHLIVEARDTHALTRGINGLCVRMAKRVNRLLWGSGRFFADRHHRVPLKTARAVRNGLRYVLGNFRKHRRARGAEIDPYSSAPYFPGFTEFGGRCPFEVSASVVPGALAPPTKIPTQKPRTWLLSTGWTRAGGRISVKEGPKDSRS